LIPRTLGLNLLPFGQEPGLFCKKGFCVFVTGDGGHFSHRF
jgi:hypothetical protein